MSLTLYHDTTAQSVATPRIFLAKKIDATYFIYSLASTLESTSFPQLEESSDFGHSSATNAPVAHLPRSWRQKLLMFSRIRFKFARRVGARLILQGYQPILVSLELSFNMQLERADWARAAHWARAGAFGSSRRIRIERAHSDRAGAFGLSRRTRIERAHLNQADGLGSSGRIGIERAGLDRVRGVESSALSRSSRSSEWLEWLDLLELARSQIPVSTTLYGTRALSVTGSFNPARCPIVELTAAVTLSVWVPGGPYEFNCCDPPSPAPSNPVPPPTSPPPPAPSTPPTSSPPPPTVPQMAYIIATPGGTAQKSATSWMVIPTTSIQLTLEKLLVNAPSNQAIRIADTTLAAAVEQQQDCAIAPWRTLLLISSFPDIYLKQLSLPDAEEAPPDSITDEESRIWNIDAAGVIAALWTNSGADSAPVKAIGFVDDEGNIRSVENLGRSAQEYGCVRQATIGNILRGSVESETLGFRLKRMHSIIRTGRSI
ncbi:hypothetical protein DFH09DRAFT_1287833 [Mycena vulgaris]|nr:hypothetical protein DFH09DRAFT_1287833 [Mycena vulgaris]